MICSAILERVEDTSIFTPCAGPHPVRDPYSDKPNPVFYPIPHWNSYLFHQEKKTIECDF